MAISTFAKPAVHTAEDLERLSAQGYHYELIKGELRPMSPSGGPHGDATSRITFYVNGLVYAEALGDTFAAETGFIVDHNPDSVLAPDFSFVAVGRLSYPLQEGYIPLAPDLAVETRSPNDTKKEVADKVQDWLAAGVRMVWVIEPRQRTLTMHRPGQPPRIFGVADTLDGGDVLPGLSVPISAIFPH